MADVPRKVGRIDHWAIYRREDGAWWVGKLGDEPGTGWAIQREWSLGTVHRTRSRDELSAQLRDRMPPDVRAEVADRLVEKIP